MLSPRTLSNITKQASIWKLHLFAHVYKILGFSMDFTDVRIKNEKVLFIIRVGNRRISEPNQQISFTNMHRTWKRNLSSFDCVCACVKPMESPSITVPILVVKNRISTNLGNLRSLSNAPTLLVRIDAGHLETKCQILH